MKSNKLAYALSSVSTLVRMFDFDYNDIEIHIPGTGKNQIDVAIDDPDQFAACAVTLKKQPEEQKQKSYYTIEFEINETCIYTCSTDDWETLHNRYQAAQAQEG